MFPVFCGKMVQTKVSYASSSFSRHTLEISFTVTDTSCSQSGNVATYLQISIYFVSLPKHFVIKALVRIDIFQSKINPLKITSCSSWKLIKNWRLWKSVKIEGRVMSLHKIMLSQVKEFFLIPQLPEFQATRAYKWRKMRHGSKVVNEICCFCSYAKKRCVRSQFRWRKTCCCDFLRW